MNWTMVGPRPPRSPAARWAAGLLGGAALLIAGCAGPGAGFPGFGPASLQPGATIEQARRSFGGPTAEFPLEGGGQRLEFAMGSFGKLTYMLDFDASGRLVKNEQVLTEQNFNQIQPGMWRDEVLFRLGRPSHVFGVPRQHIAVWNYRFFAGDCVWYQISMSDEGRVTEAGMGTDPACDGPSRRR